MNLFIFGLGYSASATAALLRKMSWQVRGTVRSPAKFEALKRQGFEPFLFNDRAGIEAALAHATYCLVSVPPGEAGDPVLAAYGDALRGASPLRGVGYLSTIGVYGDLNGGWADEDTPAGPETGRGAA